MIDRKISYCLLVNTLKLLRTKGDDELFFFFLRACEQEALDICQACLDAGADINIIESFHHNTLFTEMISQGTLTITIADWLISKGADINKSNIVPEQTPLSLACYHGNFEWVKYFIEKGAKTDCPSRSLLCQAIDSDIHHNVTTICKIVELLLNSGAPTEETNKYEYFNPFVNAVSRKYSEVVKLLLKSGISPNHYSNEGRVPLHIAVANGDVETARILLECKADVNAPLSSNCYLIKSYKGASNSMDIAIAKKDTEMIKLLVYFGGEASEQFKKVQTLVELSSDKDVASIVNLTII